MSMRRANGDGTAAKQKKNGQWYRTVTVNGKRKFVYGNSKTEVNRKFKEMMAQKQECVVAEIQKRTVEEYILDWLITYKKIELKPKSYDTLESTIHHQIIPHFKGYQFFAINHDDVQKFINKLDAEGRSYSLIRKAYLALNACYKYAMMKNQILRNPCFGAKLPKKAKKDIKGIQILSSDEIRAYCKHATERYSNGKCVYRLGYGLVLILFTGLRLGEAMGLMWEDINFQKQTLSVKRTLEYVKNRDKEDSTTVTSWSGEQQNLNPANGQFLLIKQH